MSAAKSQILNRKVSAVTAPIIYIQSFTSYLLLLFLRVRLVKTNRCKNSFIPSASFHTICHHLYIYIETIKLFCTYLMFLYVYVV